ncbi:DUF4446 family protein [Patescibacteria group bacterium]
MFDFIKKNRKEPENIEEVLDSFKKLEKNFEKISEEFKKLKKEGKFSLQKMGMVRFNPFSDVGGDQSFSIALLNSQNDGFVITSLFSREGNRVYAKSIKGAESQHSLSKEEREAIDQAQNSQISSPES